MEHPPQATLTNKSAKNVKTQGLGSNHLFPVGIGQGNSLTTGQYLPSIHTLTQTTYEGGFKALSGRSQIPINGAFNQILSSKNKGSVTSVNQAFKAHETMTIIRENGNKSHSGQGSIENKAPLHPE